MKFALVTFVFLFVQSALAQSWQDSRVIKVLKVISEQKLEWEVELTEETFVSNLDGYSCPWPGIIGPDFVFTYMTDLRHGRSGMDHNGLRIKFKQEREFCGGGSGFPDQPQDVFGPEYVVGSKIKMDFKVKREIVLVNGSSRPDKYLREVITSKLFTRELSSSAYILIE